MGVGQAFDSVSTVVSLASDHWFRLRLCVVGVPGPPARLVILQMDSQLSLLRQKDTEQDQ